MGLFKLFKKTQNESQVSFAPYADPATNLIYNLLFCDNLDLYKSDTKQPYSFPFDVLFSDTGSVTDLHRIINDLAVDPRMKVLAYNKLLSNCHKPAKRELLAVIVEMGLDKGLDVLASFKNGTARYINQTGSVFVWETTDDETSNELTNQLFLRSREIINKIGPSDKPRRSYPTKGNLRITFLVSDGLYFGEGPIHSLFIDPMANPALESAAQLMKYLTEKSLKKQAS